MLDQLVHVAEDGTPVTTSLAIAEGVQRPHHGVIQVVRKNLVDFESFGPLAFQMRKGDPLPQGGFAKATEVAILNEQQATLLVTFMRNIGIVKDFKVRLVKAFFDMRDQLRQAATAPDPADMSRMDILKMAIASEEERLKLEHDNRRLEQQIEQDRPQVKFAQQVEMAEDQLSVSLAAKVLGTGQKRLFAFMRRNGWVTRYNEPYQDKIAAGYLDVKIGHWRHPTQGIKESITAMVTGKGLVKLQDLMTTQNTGRLKSGELFSQRHDAVHNVH